MIDPAKLFRVTLEVADLESATEVYVDLFGQQGERHPGARHYFDCGGRVSPDISSGRVFGIVRG